MNGENRTAEDGPDLLRIHGSIRGPCRCTVHDIWPVSHVTRSSSSSWVSVRHTTFLGLNSVWNKKTSHCCFGSGTTCNETMKQQWKWKRKWQKNFVTVCFNNKLHVPNRGKSHPQFPLQVKNLALATWQHWQRLQSLTILCETVTISVSDCDITVTCRHCRTALILYLLIGISHWRDWRHLDVLHNSSIVIFKLKYSCHQSQTVWYVVKLFFQKYNHQVFLYFLLFQHFVLSTPMQNPGYAPGSKGRKFTTCTKT